MIIEESVYLEHYGKKGMRWGKRKNKPPLTPKQRQKIQERNVKIIQGVMVTVGAALWISALLADGSGKPSGSYKQATKNVPPKVARSAADLINDRRNVEVASLKRMHKEGKMDASQQENFLRILNARYDRKIAAVV